MISHFSQGAGLVQNKLLKFFNVKESEKRHFLKICPTLDNFLAENCLLFKYFLNNQNTNNVDL